MLRITDSCIRHPHIYDESFSLAPHQCELEASTNPGTAIESMPGRILWFLEVSNWKPSHPQESTTCDRIRLFHSATWVNGPVGKWWAIVEGNHETRFLPRSLELCLHYLQFRKTIAYDSSLELLGSSTKVGSQFYRAITDLSPFGQQLSSDAPRTSNTMNILSSKRRCKLQCHNTES